MKLVVLHCVLGLVFTSYTLAQNPKPTAQTPEPQGRQIKIILKTGQELRGILVKMDSQAVEFTIEGTLQTIDTGKVETISFVVVAKDEPSQPKIIYDLPPKILYKEKASYTNAARAHGTEGKVVLGVIFFANGKVGDIKVIRGLPDGLNEQAIEAAKKIRFEPAVKNGKTVDVRGNLEFSFKLDR